MLIDLTDDETPPETVRRSEPEIGDGDCTVTLTLTDFGVVELVTETDEWSDAELCQVGRRQVRFDKGTAASAADGATRLRLSGHDVYVEEGGYGDETCVARVVNRRYQNDSGGSLVEMALVVADGDQPMEQRCALATTFAGPVAAKLPS